MGEILVEARAASQADVDAALADQSAGEPSRLGEILLSQGKLTPLALAQGLAVQLSLPFTDLAYVAPEASDLVPLEFQRAHKIVPFRVDEENGVRRVHVAVADPTLQDVIDELRAQLKTPVVVHVASVEDVEAVHSALGGDVVAGALIEGSIIDDVGAGAQAGGDFFGGPVMDSSAEPQAPFAGMDSDPFGSFGGAEGPGSLETTVPMKIGELPPRSPAPAFADDPLAAYDNLLSEPAALEPQTADPVFELPVSAESPIDVSSFEIDAPVASDQQALAAVADDAEALDGILVDEPEHDPVTAIGVSPALVDATKEDPEFVTAIKFSPALVAATRGGNPSKKPEQHPTADDLFGDLEPVSAEPLTADLAETIGSPAPEAPAGLMGALQPIAPIMPPLPKVAMSPPPPVIPKHNAIPSIAILPEDPLLPDLQPAPPPPPPPPKMSPGPQPNSSPAALGRIALKRVAVVTPADGGPARTVEIPRAAIVDSAEKAKAEFAAAERALEAAAKKAEAEQAARAKAKAEAAAAEAARAQAAAEKARLEALERERVEAEARAKAEAEAKAAEEAAARARAEAEEQARLEADAKAREEEEAKARAQAAAKARADAEFERLKQEAAAKARARAQEQAAAKAKAKAEAEAAEKARAEEEAARLAEEERQKAEAEAARLAEEQKRAEAEALARAEAEAAQAKAEAELAQARAEAEAAEAAARLEAERAAAAEIAAAQVEPVPDDLGSADTEVRPTELPVTIETHIPIPPEAVPSTAPPPESFVLPDWMKVPGEAPPAYLDPKATTSAGLKRLLDSIETASPLEQGRMLASLVKLLVERGLLDVKEVIAALNKP
ncbi:MAG: hypothetical protein QM723_38510 [Myxococcaceae bacterium]